MEPQLQGLNSGTRDEPGRALLMRVKRIRKREHRQSVPAGNGYIYYRRNFGREAQDYRVRTTISTETKAGHSRRKTLRFEESREEPSEEASR